MKPASSSKKTTCRRPKSKKMKLSAAMIVKNEQANLPRCLNSIRAVCDEIVVVDTGSLDQTVKIAKDFGCKVYYHPWENNFAKHRNQSFGYATGNWIMQIDADEELVFLDNCLPHVFTKFLEQVPKQIHAIGLPMDDMVKGQIAATTQMVRIFRKGKVKYRRKIHNEPVFKGKVGLFTKARFKHYGYDLDEFQKKTKAKRTIGLLKECLVENPRDYDSMHYIAQAYTYFMDDLDKGLEWAEKYALCRKKIKKGKFNNSVYYLLIIGFMKQSDQEKCFKWLQVAMKEDPESLDISMGLLRYGIWTKNLDMIGAGAKSFIDKFSNFEKTRVKTASRFVFNYNRESYLFALYHLTLTHLQYSSANVKRLRKEVGRMENKLEKDLNSGLDNWLKENETVFKHNHTLLQATEAAVALFGTGKQPDINRLRPYVDKGQRRQGAVLG